MRGRKGPAGCRLKDVEESQKLEEIKKSLRIKYRENDGVKRYTFSVKKCKICEKFYPLRFKLNKNNKIIDLAQLAIPKNKNYMIMEEIKENEIKEDESNEDEIQENESNENETKGNESNDDNYIEYEKFFYIIELTKNKNIVIGRDGNADVIINPGYKNISKSHAVINYIKDGKLLIQDTCNHCGTMVLIKTNSLLLKKEKEIYLQSGRTFFMAKICDKEEYERIKTEKENQKEKTRDNIERKRNN